MLKFCRVFWCIVLLSLMCWLITTGLVVEVAVLVATSLFTDFEGYEWAIGILVVLTVVSFLYDSALSKSECHKDNNKVESEEMIK